VQCSLKIKMSSSSPYPPFPPQKHNKIYGPYNTVSTFIKHMKYDKADELIIAPPQSLLMDRLLSLVITPSATETCAGNGPTSVLLNFMHNLHNLA